MTCQIDFVALFHRRYHLCLLVKETTCNIVIKGINIIIITSIIVNYFIGM